MEKIAYQLWKKDSDSLEIFKNKLLSNLAKDVSKLVSELQINIADADVALASNLVQSNYSPSPNAIIFVKVKSYFSSGEIELQLDKVTKKIEGFIVSESIILENEKKSPLGSRTEGFSQIVFLEKHVLGGISKARYS